MLRRFSPFQLVFALVVVALWGTVLSDQGALEVTRQQLHNSFVPYSRTYSYDSFDDSRAEDRIVRASVNSGDVRSLIDHFPDDTAVLAIYVRRSKALLNFHRDGPLRSRFVAWSVQVREPLVPTLVGMPPGVSWDSGPNFPAAEETDEMLRLIAHGQKLEPQNTYWDWMEMAALAAGGRDNELPPVVRRASLKQEWDDHVTGNIRADALWNKRRRSLFTPAAKTFGFSGTLLHHLSLVREVTRSLAHQVMGLRLQGRDNDALQLGLQTMRLARIVRLNANLPITSAVGASCERIILRSARVPVGKRVALPFPSPYTALAKDSESLLFLAQKHSPVAAREIASEWTRLNGWGMDSVPDLYGGLVPRDSLERVAWTTRAVSYGMMAVPAALAIWIVLALVVWRWNITPVGVSPWGSVAGVTLPVGLLATDWTMRAIELRANPPLNSFCMTGYVAPEEVLDPTRSFLAMPGMVWGSVTLWLGLFAFYTAFGFLRTPFQRRQSNVTTEENHPIDILWHGVKWMWRGQGRLWSLFAPLWILALAFIPVIVVGSSGYATNPLLSALALVISLAVWPGAVGVRHVAIFLRIQQRTPAPARFAAVWCALLGNFLLAALLCLPLLIWAQSRFEGDFNRHFAPIEKGQMVRAIQRMRGVPMQ